MTTEQQRTIKSHFPAATKGIRALVAEDNVVNQTFIAHVLTQLGISFRIVNDGMEAVRAAEVEAYDLVFMDLQMPNMGGLEACALILRLEKNHKLPIVGLTAETMHDVKIKCLDAGMKEYISKPFKRSDIETVLIKLGFSISPIPMQNFDHDKALLKITIDMIAAEIPLILSEIETHLQRESLPDAKRGMHTLKGHCKLVGEIGFSEFLQSLENQLERGISPNTESVEHLKSNLKTLQHRLRLLVQ